MNLGRAHRRLFAAVLSPAARVAALLAGALVLGPACGGDGTAADEGGGDFGTGDGDDVSGDEGDGAGGDDGSAPAEDEVCFAPEDCVAVSSTCCGCPDFAVRADSSLAGACEGVECEGTIDCPLVVAACVDFQCALVCEPVVATLVCDSGFARDAFGCLIDACRTEPPDPVVACDADPDCTQVPADCCGCSQGGVDTAVNVNEVEDYLESLACRRDPACPGLDVCDASQVPRCVAGGCTLRGSDDGGSTDDGGDDGDGDGDGDGSGSTETLCGAPELPPCPSGQVCVLNYQDGEDATRIGVGTCIDA